MTAPLDGVRVLELASFVAAPAAGALRADLGAEVIKVEVPQGEILRHTRPKLMGFDSDFPEAPHFHMENRGKRSLALDLARPGATEAVRRVADRVDVVLTNMLPDRLAKYGLDAATLRARRPELVFAALSGYGHAGPEATRPAFDYTAYWARTGMMDLMRDPEAPPAFLRPGVGDHAAALSLATGILAALRVRDRTGEGQVVDVSLQRVGLYVLGNDAAMTLATGQDPEPHDRRRPRNPLWNQYETSDDRWLFLVMIESDRYWASLCHAIDRPDLAADPRYAGARERYRASEALTAALAETFASKPLDAWRQRLDEHRLIWAPVQTLVEATREPQARATGVFQEIDHPRAGRFETVAPPLEMSAHAMKGNRPAPDLGADGEAVLREAGLSEQEIRALLTND